MKKIAELSSILTNYRNNGHSAEVLKFYDEVPDTMMLAQGYPNERNNSNGAGNALKSCRQVDHTDGDNCATSEHPRWDSDGTHQGFDQFGFSGLPGSFREGGGSFQTHRISEIGLWWSATESTENNAVCRIMRSHIGHVEHTGQSKSRGFSVRCIRND